MICIFAVNSAFVFVSADSVFPVNGDTEVWVVANCDGEIYSKWLKLVIHENQWHISADDACYYAGFESWSEVGSKIKFTRQAFYDELYLIPDHREFSVYYEGNSIVIDGIKYYNFNELMDKLRTVVTYDTYRNQVVFDACEAFPYEINQLCHHIVNDEDFYMEGEQEASVWAAIGLNFTADVLNIWKTLSGKDTDEVAVLKAILNTPAFTDTTMTEYFHPKIERQNWAQNLLDFTSYMSSQKWDQTYNLWTYAGRNYDNPDWSFASAWSNSYASDYLTKLDKAYNARSGINLKKYLIEDYNSPTYTSTDFITSACWAAYETFEEVSSWETVYVKALDIAFLDSEIDEAVSGRLKTGVNNALAYFEDGEFKPNELQTLTEIMRNEGKKRLFKSIKNQLATPYVAYITLLDQALGASETVSEARQTYVVNEIQHQCSHRIAQSFSVVNEDAPNVMGQKYIAILYLRAYMYACSLWADGTALSRYSALNDGNPLHGMSKENRDVISSYYTDQIDRAAPILATLIQLSDDDYVEEVHNCIGNTNYDGYSMSGVVVCLIDGSEHELYDIKVMYYYRDGRDFDRIKTSLESGSHFFFGTYEQDNITDNGPEPIEWEVLELNDDTVKVQSVLILDCQKLGSEYAWYNSKLRTWANKVFINDAFDETERPRLAYMQYMGKMTGSDSSNYAGDYSAVDRVQMGITGKTVTTEYASSKGLDYENSYWCTDYYYLSGLDSRGHQFIDGNGKITAVSTYYHDTETKSIGVRPSISISLDPDRDVKDILYSNAQNGDLVAMGKDELDNNPDNGLEDIEWIVMGRSDNKLLLQTYYDINGIANQSYTDWGTSELREWLNNDFYNGRFTDFERSYLVKTNLIQSRGYTDEDYFFPQENMVRLFKYASSSYFSYSYLRCKCEGITNPITVCTVISVGEQQETYQTDIYTYDKTEFSDSVGDYHIGDEILLGNYEQDMISSDGRESIEWIIIALQGNRALLLSKRSIEYASYAWRSNGLKTWLKNDFYNDAFNDEEKEIIYNKAFLLNKTQYERMLTNVPYNQALLTHYAYYQSFLSGLDICGVRNGKYVNNPFSNSNGVYSVIGTKYGEWWLSDWSVKADGNLVSGSTTVYNAYVRPAIWINLPTVYFVSTEEEFRDALFGHEGQTYTINITGDFELTGNYSSSKILHGDINFNGHTLTVRRYSNSDTFKFGDSDSVTVNLNGEDCPGATIVLTQPFVNFTIGAAESQINSVEIVVDGTPGITPAQVLKSSLAMEDRIGVNFFLDLPDEFLEDEGAYIQINELQYSIPSKDSRGRYPFRYYIAAAQQRDDIVLTAHLSDGTVYPLLDKAGEDVTSTGYVYSGINYTAEARNGGAAATLMDMLDRLNDFGKYAQVYFDYYPELGEFTDRAGDIDNVTLAMLNRYAPVITATSNCGIRRSGSTLMLESATTVTHNFIIDRGTVDDYIFMVDGKVITTESTGDITLKLVEGKYRISIGNIVAAHLQDSYEVVVTDKTGNELIRISNYSALSYAQVVISHYGETPADENNAKLVNMLKSLYLYNRAAMVWFQVEEEEVPAPSTLEAEEEAVIADEEPAAEEEAIAEPVIEAPVEEEITEETEETEESASEEPITEEPIAEELVTEEPAIELQTEE